MAVTVQPATAADYATFARLFVELAVPEPTPSEERFVSLIAPDALIARVDGAIAGYAWARTRGDALHVVHVVTDPAFRRRGVGEGLMNAMAALARERGHTRWMLNVKPDNLAARALYERCGLRAVFESASVRLRWADLSRVAPAEVVAADARIARVDPAEDSRFERDLGLLPNEIAAARKLDRIVVGAEAGGRALGILALDPPFPGASPVRVKTPGVARVLLEAVREAARPDRDHLFVFAEGHPALVDALVEAGGEIALSALRMEGDVPNAR